MLDLARQEGQVSVQRRVGPVDVYGAGTTGSWTAQTLCRMGFENVRIIDFDKVESHNLPAQFHVNTPGVSKVEAVAAAMKLLGLPEPKHRVNGRAENNPPRRGAVVISCFDNFEARKVIAKAAAGAAIHRLIDMRMGLESGSALFAGPMTLDRYVETLNVETVPELGCGKRALAPTGLALVGCTLSHWLACERDGIDPQPRIDWVFRDGMAFQWQ